MAAELGQRRDAEEVEHFREVAPGLVDQPLDVAQLRRGDAGPADLRHRRVGRHGLDLFGWRVAIRKVLTRVEVEPEAVQRDAFTSAAASRC